MKITKRQLRRIIKEERTKILKEMNGPGANDPRYRQARAIFEEAQEAVVDMLGFGIEDIQEMAENKSDLSFAAFLDEADFLSRPALNSDQMRESLDNMPPGEYSLSGTPGGPVDPASLELGQGDYAPYGHKDELDQALLDRFAHGIRETGETVEDFMEYIGNQDIYMKHGKNHRKFRPLYIQALRRIK